MKNAVRFLLVVSVFMSLGLRQFNTLAMPSPSRPTPVPVVGASPPASAAPSIQWLNPINQGISAWISQQVQARQAANVQKQVTQRQQLLKPQFLQSSPVTGAPVSVS